MPPRAALCLVLLTLLSSCANVPLHQGVSLTSYAGMAPSGGALTNAKLRVDSAPVLAAQTVSIVPTSVQTGSGSAIAPEDLAHIFDPYFTTRRAGTGLGLPIAKNIIEGLGGTLFVSSRSGAGTEIAIDLPLTARPAA